MPSTTVTATAGALRQARSEFSDFLTSELHSIESCRHRRRWTHKTCRSGCLPTCQRYWHRSATTRATTSSPPARPRAGTTHALPSFRAAPRIPDHPHSAVRTERRWSRNKDRAANERAGRADGRWTSRTKTKARIGVFPFGDSSWQGAETVNARRNPRGLADSTEVPRQLGTVQRMRAARCWTQCRQLTFLFRCVIAA